MEGISRQRNPFHSIQICISTKFYKDPSIHPKMTVYPFIQKKIIPRRLFVHVLWTRQLVRTIFPFTDGVDRVGMDILLVGVSLFYETPRYRKSLDDCGFDSTPPRVFAKSIFMLWSGNVSPPSPSPKPVVPVTFRELIPSIEESLWILSVESDAF